MSLKRFVLANIDEALQADGSVVTWGDGDYGGDAQEAYPAQSGWSSDRLVSLEVSHKLYIYIIKLIIYNQLTLLN